MQGVNPTEPDRTWVNSRNEFSLPPVALTFTSFSVYCMGAEIGPGHNYPTARNLPATYLQLTADLNSEMLTNHSSK